MLLAKPGRQRIHWLLSETYPGLWGNPEHCLRFFLPPSRNSPGLWPDGLSVVLLYVWKEGEVRRFCLPRVTKKDGNRKCSQPFFILLGEAETEETLQISRSVPGLPCMWIYT